jgi:hypothetical protein
MKIAPAFVLLTGICLISVHLTAQPVAPASINLAGDWLFKIDPNDVGQKEKWFTTTLTDHVQLPGSMAGNKKGYDISVNTPWMGDIIDSSWFTNAAYAQYRAPGHIKVPFWLQPNKYYAGPAWYQKTVTVPANWKGKTTALFIERAHWQTMLWVDDKKIGGQNSLSTPHVYNLTQYLSPGRHVITVRIDNRVLDINPGPNSHSISDHTQTNWNGMIGRLSLNARPQVFIQDVQLYPDVERKMVRVHLQLQNSSGAATTARVQLQVIGRNKKAAALPSVTTQIQVTDSTATDIEYAMGDHPLLWDEFDPNLYTLKVQVTGNGQTADVQEVTFGMRQFATQGTQFTINNRLTFLRGTLECAIFPKTGYPPTDKAAWARIFTICRSFGLNHMRFHSWCPPDAAFEAADSLGFYLHIEIASWANQGSSVGDGAPIDQYIYDESNRIVKSYGNHPSFCMMAYGNEPAGKHQVQYLTRFVEYWKNKDPRRLYTTGSGWPVIPESNYNSTPDPRIQRWGEGLKSIINGEPPRTDYDWRKIIAPFQHPTVSHEIGQWCVYPDFKEIKKYTGVLKANNFEIFRDQLARSGLQHLADSFLLASGKLQTLCYKADIEAALRTPGFGGFQLLDLHDFPGQGTALVGVLNAFWEEKGYVGAREYRRFCNAVVPLARFSKMIWLNNEQLTVPVEIANFGNGPLHQVQPQWRLENEKGIILSKGTLATTDIPLGNAIALGTINTSLSAITTASRLTLSVRIGNYENSWEIYVYPAVLPEVNTILVKQALDEEATQQLNKGGSVLLTLKKGTVPNNMGGNIAIGFSSIFWNTAWTHAQPPVTLGILCDPRHPALASFPTGYHSNYQWWDAMTHSSALMLDGVSKGLQPIVRVVDDWVTARSLGLVFECKAGKGKLLVSGIDLLTDQESRPAARQLLYSLKKYMASAAFRPVKEVSVEAIQQLQK